MDGLAALRGYSSSEEEKDAHPVPKADCGPMVTSNSSNSPVDAADEEVPATPSEVEGAAAAPTASTTPKPSPPKAATATTAAERASAVEPAGQQAPEPSKEVSDEKLTGAAEAAGSTAADEEPADATAPAGAAPPPSPLPEMPLPLAEGAAAPAPPSAAEETVAPGGGESEAASAVVLPPPTDAAHKAPSEATSDPADAAGASPEGGGLAGAAAAAERPPSPLPELPPPPPASTPEPTATVTPQEVTVKEGEAAHNLEVSTAVPSTAAKEPTVARLEAAAAAADATAEPGVEVEMEEAKAAPASPAPTREAKAPDESAPEPATAAGTRSIVREAATGATEATRVPSAAADSGSTEAIVELAEEMSVDEAAQPPAAAASDDDDDDDAVVKAAEEAPAADPASRPAIAASPEVVAQRQSPTAVAAASLQAAPVAAAAAVATKEDVEMAEAEPATAAATLPAASPEARRPLPAPPLENGNVASAPNPPDPAAPAPSAAAATTTAPPPSATSAAIHPPEPSASPPHPPSPSASSPRPSANTSSVPLPEVTPLPPPSESNGVEATAAAVDGCEHATKIEAGLPTMPPPPPLAAAAAVAATRAASASAMTETAIHQDVGMVEAELATAVPSPTPPQRTGRPLKGGSNDGGEAMEAAVARSDESEDACNGDEDGGQDGALISHQAAALLGSNARLIRMLVAMQRLQAAGGGRPSPQQCRLFWEAQTNLATVLEHCASPLALAAAGPVAAGRVPPVARVATNARALGLLPVHGEGSHAGTPPFSAPSLGVRASDLLSVPQALYDNARTPEPAPAPAPVPKLHHVGDERMTWQGRTGRPAGWTGEGWHKLERLEGLKFYKGVTILDADNPHRVYSFNLDDTAHAACFRMSDTGADDHIRISYSNLYALYELPDGSKWAEHGYFYDKDDLVEHVEHHNSHRASTTAALDVRSLLPPNHTDREVMRLVGRFHSLLNEIEDECWVYEHSEYQVRKKAKQLHNPEDTYFYRITIDAARMAVVSTAPAGSASVSTPEPVKRRIGRPPGSGRGARGKRKANF